MGSGNAERGSLEIELQGKMYTVLQLDLKELGDIENFIKSKYARLYRASSEGMKPKDREAGVRDILRTKYTTEEFNEEMSAYDVVHYVAFLSLRNNPGVTLESIDQIVNQGNLDVLTTAMNSFGEDDENPPPEEEIP
jgi:hypothetical protein